MNSQNSIDNVNKSIFKTIQNNWNNLDDPYKTFLTKGWKILTYKWQFQILLNLPFLLWWLLDKSFTQIHEYDLKLISSLNLPSWLTSMIGFGQILN